jgi:hypothetical protein
VLEYLAHPRRFDTGRAPLCGYLSLAARRNLLDVKRIEARRARREAMTRVDPMAELNHSLIPGEVPAWELAEAWRRDRLKTLEPFIASLTELDREVFALMLAGERRTTRFAQLIGAGQWKPLDQRRAVHRVKNRLLMAARRWVIDRHEVSRP